MRDDRQWTDPDSGEVFPPSMTYRTQLLGQRPDDVNIGVSVVATKDYDQIPADKREAYIDSLAANAAFQFESYIDCACVVGAPCPKHFPGRPR